MAFFFLLFYLPILMIFYWGHENSPSSLFFGYCFFSSLFCYFFLMRGIYMYNAHLISFGIGGSLFSFFAALVFLLAALFADLLMFPVTFVLELFL